MRKVILSALLMFGLMAWSLSPAVVQGQKVLTTPNTPDVEDFQDFRGEGFSPSPDPGQLNSNAFAMFGMSDGDTGFGNTNTSGDFARGLSDGQVGTGGMYAFEVEPGIYTMGLQPGGSDMTPGTIYVCYQNDTGSTIIDGFNVEYDLWVYNDQDRGQIIELKYLTGGGCLTDGERASSFRETGLTFEIDENAQSPTEWERNEQGAFIETSLDQGSFITLALVTDDNTGSGARPEFSFNNLSVTPDPANPIPVELASFTAQLSGDRAQLQWETLSETNNAGFDIQHQAPQSSAFSSLGFVEGRGTTDEPQSYRFTTDALAAGTHTFRLRQIDLDGTDEIHEAITVQVRQGEVMRMTGSNPVTAGATTSFTVQLDQQDDITVAVYNVLGQRVQTLHAGPAQPNEVLRLTLDTSGLASGMYFVRTQGSSVRETQRVTVVR